VALRFYTRGCLLQNVLGAEDWLILVALVFAGATCAGMVEREYRYSLTCAITCANLSRLNRGSVRPGEACS
jgi:hypothetical protein